MFDAIEYIPKLIYSGYTFDGKWCLIMEYFTGGTLYHHMYEEFDMIEKNLEPKINLEQKKFIVYHLACGLEALHKYKITHG